MSLFPPPTFPPHNNGHPAGSPGSGPAPTGAAASSVRSNVAFTVLVVSVVVFYKGSRLWAWLGVRAQEKRSLLVAQELVLQESGSRRRRTEPAGIAPITGPAGEGASQLASSAQAGSKESPGPATSLTPVAVAGRKRRKSKGSAFTASPASSSIAPASTRLALSPLSRPEVLSASPTRLAAPSATPSSASSPQTGNAIAGASSSGREGIASAAAPAPRPSGDRSEEDGFFTLVAPRPSAEASTAKGKGKARSTLASNDAVSGNAGSPLAQSPVVTVLSKKAKKKAAAVGTATATASSHGATTSPTALTAGLSPVSREMLLASSTSPLSQMDLSPSSSVSSLAMSASSSQDGSGGGASSEATTLASSTLSLGLEFTSLSRTLSASVAGDAPYDSNAGTRDKAARQELASTLRRLQAAQSMLESTQNELLTSSGRLQSAEASLQASEAVSAALIKELECERLAGEARSVALADARRDADDLKAELRLRDDEARRLADERKRRDKEREKLRRELERWREDGRRWEGVEREFRKTDTELRFQLHHTSAACHHQLGQIRMLEQVVRQYNLCFAPAAAAAAATVALSGQPGSPLPPPSAALLSLSPPSAAMHSLSPPPPHVRPPNRRMPSRSSTVGGAPNPFVVVPAPQFAVPYPTLPEPESTSEEDVSDDVALSILKNPGGLGVGNSSSTSRRSRTGSVDSSFDTRSGSSISTRPDDDDRSIGSPSAAAADNGTPELVFASIPSYDEHARPRSAAAGSSQGDVSISPAQNCGRSEHKQPPPPSTQLVLDDASATTLTTELLQPAAPSPSAPEVNTTRA